MNTTIKVANPQYGQLHQYRTSFNDPARQQMYCSGGWYDLEMAPCVVAMENALPDPADLPPCEMSDEDLAAARELLGNPGITICKQKGRASWDDVVLPAKVQAVANLNALLLGTAPQEVLTSGSAIRRLIEQYENRLISFARLKDIVAP